MVRDKISNEQVIEALNKSFGILADTAKKLRIARSTLMNWIAADPELQQARLDAIENGLDFTESKLIENIRNNKEASIIFKLKTMGRSRGYIEQQNISIFQEQPLFPEFLDNDAISPDDSDK